MANYLAPTQRSKSDLLSSTHWLDHAQNWDWLSNLELGGHALADYLYGAPLGCWLPWQIQRGFSAIPVSAINFKLDNLPLRTRQFMFRGYGLLTDRAGAANDSINVEFNDTTGGYNSFYRTVTVGANNTTDNLGATYGYIPWAAAASNSDNDCFGQFDLRVFNPCRGGLYDYPYAYYRSHITGTTTAELFFAWGNIHWNTAGRVWQVEFSPVNGTRFECANDYEWVVTAWVMLGAEE